MKTKLLFIAAMLSCGISISQQIANPIFSDWSEIDLFEGPADWSDHSNIENSEFLNLTLSSDAAHLTHSVRLETLDSLGDTSFAYVVHGYMGDSGPESGIPYSGFILDSLIFWTKYDIQTTDSATVLFSAFSGGSPLGFESNKLFGTQATWTRIALPLSSTPFAPDEVLVAFASSDALNEFALPGSWMMVDNVQLKDTSGAIFLPPNNSFEVWDTVRREEADDWYTSNLFYSEDTLAFKTTDAFTGSFAMELETREANGDTLQAYMSNGPAEDWWFGKVPYIAQPTQLGFSFKYFPSGVDSGNVSINFFNSGLNVGGGFYRFNTTTSTYTYDNVSLSLSSAPDSMQIIVFAGQNPGTRLLIDNFALTGGTVGVEEKVNFSGFAFHYPNPVVDELTIQVGNSIITNNTTLNIVDMNGKVVYNGQLTNRTTKLNLNKLAKGTYSYVIRYGEELISKKFIKQ